MGVALQLSSPAQMPHTKSVAGSLLFPLEVEEGSSHPRHPSTTQLLSELQLLRSNVEFFLRPQSIFAAKLLRDVRAYKKLAAAEGEEFDVVSLAARLSTIGYRVHVRNALGGGEGTACFHNLRHEFLIVQGEADHEGVDFIVEPAFQAQFQISHSTPRYDGLLEMIPSDLVTTPAMLGPLVQLLCTEMQLAFEHHGLSLPPWRQSKSMLSKWLPQKSRDFEPSPYGSPRAAAASPEPYFPMLGPPSAFAAASSRGPASSSGYQTPRDGGDDDPASPRAVLAGASAVLIGQASPAHPQQQPAIVRAKSLLSDRLAAATIPDGGTKQQGSGGKQQGSSAKDPAAAAPAGPPSLYRVSAGSGLVYRVESDWQEPPIRTVKMQGGAQRK